MKRLILSLALLCGFSIAANAQFEQGTKYVGASLTGLQMSYSKNAEFKFGLDAVGGYYVADCWMLKGNFTYDHAKSSDDLTIGAGARYNFIQNGIYLGAGLEYQFQNFGKKIETVVNAGNTPITVESNDRYNNLRVPVEIGYTFYLNHYITLEPAIYSKMSLNHFSDGTEFGFKLGIGYYFKRTIAGRTSF